MRGISVGSAGTCDFHSLDAGLRLTSDESIPMIDGSFDRKRDYSGGRSTVGFCLMLPGPRKAQNGVATRHKRLY